MNNNFFLYKNLLHPSVSKLIIEYNFRNFFFSFSLIINRFHLQVFRSKEFDCSKVVSTPLSVGKVRLKGRCCYKDQQNSCLDSFLTKTVTNLLGRLISIWAISSGSAKLWLSRCFSHSFAKAGQWSENECVLPPTQDFYFHRQVFLPLTQTIRLEPC